MHIRNAATLALALGLSSPGVAIAQPSLTDLARTWPGPTAGPRTEPADVVSSPGRSSDTSTQAQPSPGDLKVSVYPILVWVPAFTATTTVPAFPDRPDGPDFPGGSGSTERSFDGAALAGFSIEKANWRIDADGIYAALASQRDTPLLRVDLDLIYGHVSGGVKIYKDLYVTGGVRRVALKYDIQLNDRPQHFERKPGIWNPLVGLGLHTALGSRWTLHAIGEGGGFGVGADVDLSGSIRADVAIARHFGLTLGYSLLYLKLSDSVRDRTFEVKQTLHGPVAGVALYF